MSAVIQGTALDMRSLARQAELTEHYVGKVLACAFLGPDIIESILEGRQPHDLNFEKLCQHAPLSWAEQRRQFGFPQDPRPDKSGAVAVLSNRWREGNLTQHTEISRPINTYVFGALSKDCPLFWKSYDCSTPVNGREEDFRIESTASLGRRHRSHD
jgi:hypothetical protein